MKEFIEKLIERLEELADYNGNAYLDTADVFEEINQLAEEYINTSTDTSSGWISVKDGLPSDEKGYLVTLRDGEVTFAKYDKGEKMWVDTIEEYYEYPVIAWQPLPSPYKEEE